MISTAESVGTSRTAHSSASSAAPVQSSVVELTPRGPQELRYVGLASEADFRLTSTAGRLDWIRDTDGFRTFTLLNALPDANEVAEMTANSPTVHAAVVSASQILGLGIVNGGDGFEGTSSLTFERALVGGGSSLHVGFFDAVVPSIGFERLEVQLSLDGEALADLEFTDPDLVRAGLNDVLLAFQPSSGGNDLSTLVIRYILDLEGNPLPSYESETFASRFVVYAGRLPSRASRGSSAPRSPLLP